MELIAISQLAMEMQLKGSSILVPNEMKNKIGRRISETPEY
jgi:hypothetical protein